MIDPYAGLEGLTDGLDWEAEQGRRAYETIMLAEGDSPFFVKGEEEIGEGEDEL